MGLIDEVTHRLINSGAGKFDPNSAQKQFMNSDDKKITLDPGVTRASCPNCRNMVALNERIRSWECCGYSFELAPNL